MAKNLLFSHGPFPKWNKWRPLVNHITYWLSTMSADKHLSHSSSLQSTCISTWSATKQHAIKKTSNLKFSAVLGTMSANNSNFIRPISYKKKKSAPNWIVNPIFMQVCKYSAVRSFHETSHHIVFVPCHKLFHKAEVASDCRKFGPNLPPKLKVCITTKHLYCCP